MEEETLCQDISSLKTALILQSRKKRRQGLWHFCHCYHLTIIYLYPHNLMIWKYRQARAAFLFTVNWQNLILCSLLCFPKQAACWKDDICSWRYMQRYNQGSQMYLSTITIFPACYRKGVSNFCNFGDTCSPQMRCTHSFTFYVTL